MKKLLLALTHLIVFVIGFGAGVYFLPIMVAPEAPSEQQLSAVAEASQYQVATHKDRGDSDGFHWAEGDFFISKNEIAFKGEMAPGPDYKLYLSPSYTESEQEFLDIVKHKSIQVSAVKSFDGFIISVPNGIDIEQYNSIVIWCEEYSKYISSAKYR